MILNEITGDDRHLIATALAHTLAVFAAAWRKTADLPEQLFRERENLDELLNAYVGSDVDEYRQHAQETMGQLAGTVTFQISRMLKEALYSK